MDTELERQRSQIQNELDAAPVAMAYASIPCANRVEWIAPGGEVELFRRSLV